VNDEILVSMKEKGWMDSFIAPHVLSLRTDWLPVTHLQRDSETYTMVLVSNLEEPKNQ